MGIEELVYIQNPSTEAAMDGATKPTIELKPLERNILTTAANPYYHGGYVAHVMDALGVDDRNKVRAQVESIRRKLDIYISSGTYSTIFTASCIALKDGLVSIDEILDGKDLARELPRLKVALRRLTPAQKRIMAEFYSYAVKYHDVAYDEIAETLQYTSHRLGSLFGKTIKNVYGRLGISNRAQLAFFAHVYMHFMHNPVEEQLTANQLDTLESIVRIDTRAMYQIIPYKRAILDRLGDKLENMSDVHITSSMEAVLKALDLGFYTLLLEADIPAFVSLNSAQMDFLRAAPDLHALRTKRNTTHRIYERLGIHSRAQLAPYLFLAARLDKKEIDSLRHADPNAKPMSLIYEKFGIPKGMELLAPGRYLAVKSEMATKN